MRDLNYKFRDIVQERYEQNVKSGLEAVEYIKNSTAIYKGKPVPCLYMPKIFSVEAHEYLKHAARTIYVILEKVMAKYLCDPKYRTLFPFPKALEELILSEAGYPCLLPIARIDIFLDEDDFSFKFCEFNADGSSAMNEDRELNLAIKNADAMQKMGEDYDFETFEFFDSWVRVFVDIYSSYEKKVSNPNIIITDFIDGDVSTEFTEFKNAFIRAGYDAEIVDVRSLLYEQGILKTSEGKPVHAIYRRAVTRDVMDNYEKVRSFVKAITDGNVCSIGHFRTQIIHNKIIFKILHMAETFEFLTEEESAFVVRHVPKTYVLEEGKFDLDDALQNKRDWLIKPEDLYASRGVFAGVDTPQEAWEKAVKENMSKGYLLQEYVTPYKSENLNFNDNPRPSFEKFGNITGMFVYGGKLQGFYSRGGPQGIISGLTGGLTMASVVAKNRSCNAKISADNKPPC